MSLKFPVHNIRKSIDDVWNQLNSTETRIVPSTAPYIIELYEVPDDGSVNSKPLINGLTEVISYPPGSGEFFINYDIGHISFHVDESNTSVDINYWKKGTLVEAEEINYLYDRVNTLDSMYNVDSVAPSGNIPGSQWYNTTDNIIYAYDITRGKWLSLDKTSYTFGKKGLTNKMYLSYFGGDITSTKSGFRIPRNACIVSMSGQFTNLGNGTFYIRKNNGTGTMAFLDVLNDYGNSKIDINMDINEGDILHCYFESPSTVIRDPMVTLEIAWIG